MGQNVDGYQVRRVKSACPPVRPPVDDAANVACDGYDAANVAGDVYDDTDDSDCGSQVTAMMTTMKMSFMTTMTIVMMTMAMMTILGRRIGTDDDHGDHSDA